MFLADGTECKVVTGVDDHSRFCVIATVVTRATGRAVCLAFAEGLRRYGTPDDVLTDNGKQFTDRFGKGGEVLFDRICGDNGITQRLTQPASPTTTGKVERFQCATRRRCAVRRWEPKEVGVLPRWAVAASQQPGRSLSGSIRETPGSEGSSADNAGTAWHCQTRYDSKLWMPGLIEGAAYLPK